MKTFYDIISIIDACDIEIIRSTIFKRATCCTFNKYLTRISITLNVIDYQIDEIWLTAWAKCINNVLWKIITYS